MGIWSDSFPPGTGLIPNPLDDYSVVFLPYCDGSVFTGDNHVADPAFQAFIEAALGLPPGFGPPARLHRGYQNASAGIDVARHLFPKARQIVVAGSSAGGVGAAGLTPLLIRIVFGNYRDLLVFNDAGPVAINLLDVGNILKRAADWQFDKYFPESCTECDAITGQGTAIIKWRLDNDSTVRESFYSTDGDATNRFFLQVPTQELYRGLILTEHGKLHDAYPKRYKRFIRSGAATHIALQSDQFYLNTANDVPLYIWTDGFLHSGKHHGWYDRKHHKQNAWIDIVEDFVPLPAPPP